MTHKLGFIYRRLPFHLNTAILVHKTNINVIAKENYALYSLLLEASKKALPPNDWPVIDSVLLLAYPILDDNSLDTSVTLGCICVNPKYTVYEKSSDGTEKHYLVEDGMFDLTTNHRQKGNFKKHSFNSEMDAIEFCKIYSPYDLNGIEKQNNDMIKPIYDNHHTILDEFVEMCSYAGNFCVNHKDRKSNILDHEKNIVCKECIDKLNIDGTLFADNNVLDFSLLSCNMKYNLTNKPIFSFTNPKWVDVEYLYYGETENLPFRPNLTHEYTSCFLNTIKHSCFDIETVVKKNDGDCYAKDTIVAISYICYSGMKQMTKSVYITTKMPCFNDIEEEYFSDNCPDGFVDIPIEQATLLDLIKNHTNCIDGTKIRTELKICKNQYDLVEEFIKHLEEDKPVILSHFNGLSFDSKYIVRTYFQGQLKNKSIKEDVYKNTLYTRLSFLNLNESCGWIKSKQKSKYFFSETFCSRR